LAAVSSRTDTVRAPDGRTLQVFEAGATGGPAIVYHHGTPSGGDFHPVWVQSATELGARLIGYDRPGYGGSAPHPNRTVSDAAADVAAIADALGVERFVTWGISGGGPHALACAALLGDRVAAAASLAGVAPVDAEGLDWLGGMGELNQVEFGKAREGAEVLEPWLRDEASGMLGAGVDGFVESVRTIVGPPDVAVLGEEVGGFLLGSMQRALADRVDGWRDDDLAFLRDWGFDPADIAVPVQVWQGEQDVMVPPPHGRWLAEHVPGARAHLLDGEGHLTLVTTRLADVLADLRDLAGL